MLTEQEYHFLEAARLAKCEEVSRFLKTGLSLNIHDENGWSALHHAVASQQISVVELFKDLWQNTDNQQYLHDYLGTTPLHLSVMFRNYEITDYFLKSDFPILPDKENEFAWEKINFLDSNFYKLFTDHLGKLYKQKNKSNYEPDLLINSPEFFRRNQNCVYLKFDFGKLDELELSESLNEILIIPKPQLDTHSQLEAVIERSAQWMVTQKLTDDAKKFAAARFPALVKSTLSSVNFEVLEVVGEFFGTSFIIDDILETQWEKLGQEHINDVLNSFMQLFRNPEFTKSAANNFPQYQNFCTAIIDLSLRLKSYANEGTDLDDFYQSLERYFKSCISIYISRHKGVEYSDETFHFFRKFTLGLPAAIRLCLFFYKIKLTENERSDLTLSRIEEAVLIAYATLNDIFSYYKELLKEKKPENIIVFLKQKFEKDLKVPSNFRNDNEFLTWKAFREAVKIYNRQMRDILRLYEMFSTNPNIKIYYEILIKLLRDNVDWHISQAKLRYQLTNFVSKEFTNLQEALNFKFSGQTNDNQPGPISHMTVRSF